MGKAPQKCNYKWPISQGFSQAAFYNHVCKWFLHNFLRQGVPWRNGVLWREENIPEHCHTQSGIFSLSVDDNYVFITALFQSQLVSLEVTQPIGTWKVRARALSGSCAGGPIQAWMWPVRNYWRMPNPHVLMFWIFISLSFTFISLWEHLPALRQETGTTFQTGTTSWGYCEDKLRGMCFAYSIYYCHSFFSYHLMPCWRLHPGSIEIVWPILSLQQPCQIG